MKFNCPICGQCIDAPDGLAGEEQSCPECCATVEVPKIPRRAREIYAIPIAVTTIVAGFTLFTLIRSPLPWGDAGKMAEIITMAVGRVGMVAAALFFAWRPKR